MIDLRPSNGTTFRGGGMVGPSMSFFRMLDPFVHLWYEEFPNIWASIIGRSTEVCRNPGITSEGHAKGSRVSNITQYTGLEKFF